VFRGEWVIMISMNLNVFSFEISYRKVCICITKASCMRIVIGQRFGNKFVLFICISLKVCIEH